VKKNDITLHTKHITQAGLDELLHRLARSKMITYQYDNMTGVLNVSVPRVDPILRRMKSMKSIKSMKIPGFHE